MRWSGVGGGLLLPGFVISCPTAAPLLAPLVVLQRAGNTHGTQHEHAWEGEVCWREAGATAAKAMQHTRPWTATG